MTYRSKSRSNTSPYWSFQYSRTARLTRASESKAGCGGVAVGGMGGSVAKRQGGRI
jgi:hypothetical protein